MGPRSGQEPLLIWDKKGIDHAAIRETDLDTWLTGLKGALWLVFWGNDVDQGRIAVPVSLLMGSEAPCCGGGLSGNCLLIIHFIF